MRRRLPLLLLTLLSVVAADAPVALGWGEATVHDVGGRFTATCLGATDDGRLQLLRPTTGESYAFDLLRPAATGLTGSGQPYLANVDECPRLANAGAVTVHAAYDGSGRFRMSTIRIAIDRAGVRKELAIRNASAVVWGPPAVAASPRGDALIAWQQLRGADPRTWSQRLVAQRVNAAGELGPLEPLSSWKSVRQSPLERLVAVGMDDSGTATVAWTRSLGARGRRRYQSAIVVEQAAPGAPLAVTQTAVRGVGFLESLALEVAPSGRALLGFTAGERVRLLERTGPTGPFEPVSQHTQRGYAVNAPALALRDDGAAVVAWRTERSSDVDEGRVAVSVRAPNGSFGRARLVDRSVSLQQPSNRAVLFGFSDDRVPVDATGRALRVALAPDGRFSLVWTRELPTPFGDNPSVAKAAVGSVDGSLEPAATISCACRAVNGIGALVVGGEPAVAYTDNDSADGIYGEQLAGRGGRLHLWTPSRPLTRRPPPRLTVTAPQGQRLGWRDPLRLRVRCSTDCDLRGTVARGTPRRRLRALGTASLAGGRSGLLKLWPDADKPLVPVGVRAVRVAVRAYARDGQRPVVRWLRVAARRKPLRPLPLPVDARAHRRGSALIVTWRYPFRFTDLAFVAHVRGTQPWGRLSKYRAPNRRQRYRVVLRLRPSDDPRTVVLTVGQFRPTRSRKLLVPVR